MNANGEDKEVKAKEALVEKVMADGGVELNAHGAQVRHDSAEPRSSNQAVRRMCPKHSARSKLHWPCNSRSRSSFCCILTIYNLMG